MTATITFEGLLTRTTSFFARMGQKALDKEMFDSTIQHMGYEHGHPFAEVHVEFGNGNSTQGAELLITITGNPNPEIRKIFTDRFTRLFTEDPLGYNVTVVFG